MSSSLSDHGDTRWRFTAAYRLGYHWQQTGEYARAQAAYREALRHEPDHRASLLNLAVTQIRLKAYGEALSNIVKLCDSDETLPSTPRGPVSAEALTVVYNRALVLRYLGRLEEAKQWSELIAVAVYKRGQDDDLSRLAPAGLMLHAGILLDLNKDDDVLLARATDRALARSRPVKPQKLVSDPSAIEWYVRRDLGDGS